MKRQRHRTGIILISFLLFPATFYYFSPEIIVEGAFMGAVSGSMVLFALMFLSSLVFGRAFCGWACPVGGLQESLELASAKPVRGKWKDRLKYVIWVPWLGSIVAGAVVAGGLTLFDPLFRTDHGFSVSDLHSLIIYFIVVAIVTVLSLTVGRRAFCHTLCWMAPFMVIGTKIKDALGYPSLRLTPEPGRCTGCAQCTKKCPMSLPVQEMVKKGDMRSSECILCGRCVDSCPGKSISYSFRRRQGQKKEIRVDI